MKELYEENIYNKNYELDYHYNVTFVIPAYNEEKRLKPVLKEVCNYISSNLLPWNIIVSIDGNDGTESLVVKMMQEYRFLSYNKGLGRGGKGAAVKRAVEAASGKFIILMDADGAVSFKEMIKSLNFLEQHDFIIFDRYSNPDNNIPFLRRLASRGFNILIRALLSIKVNDTQCGYKVIRRDYAMKAFNKISVSNTFFDVALIYYLQKAGARCIEIPVKYKHDDGSKFNVIGEIIGQGVSLIAFRLRNSRFYKYIPRKFVELYYRKFRWI